MLPLTLGKLLDEERQRQIESTLQRRRWLAPSDPTATSPGPSGRTATVRRPPNAARAQARGSDPICPTS